MGFRTQLAALGVFSVLLLLLNMWMRNTQPAGGLMQGQRRRAVVTRPPNRLREGFVPGRGNVQTIGSSSLAVPVAPVATTAAAQTPTAQLGGSPPSPAVAAVAVDGEACEPTPHLELWGDLVENGDANAQPTAEACCSSCRSFEPSIDVARGAQCNTWVWNPTTKACWLKHQKPDALRRADEEIKKRREKPATGGSPWVSGVWHGVKPCVDCTPPAQYRGCISKDTCNTTHACGSPAIDGYAHVDSDCLERSPTALLYQKLLAEGTELVAVHELKADYDGLGVRWGIGHQKDDWQACEAACRAHRPSSMRGPRMGPFSRLPCNTWTWCGEKVCFEPDAHSHSFGNCWLKFAEDPEAPEVNQREPMLKKWLRRHGKQIPNGVPWVSGALLAPGVTFTNGTWGPRAYW